MVCYLKDFGNEKPPLGRFVILLYFIPVYIGNMNILNDSPISYAVYPCVYREHVDIDPDARHP